MREDTGNIAVVILFVAMALAFFTRVLDARDVCSYGIGRTDSITQCVLAHTFGADTD